VRGESDDGGQTWRVSAAEIEQTICAAALVMLGDRAAIALALEESGRDPNQLQSLLKSAQMYVERLRSGAETVSALSELTERAELSREGVKLSLKLSLLSSEAGASATRFHLSVVKFVPIQLKRRGVEMKMILEGDSTPSRVDIPLLKSVARARRWSQDLIAGRVQSVGELAKREDIDRRSVRRLIRLGFLSPRIIEAIAEGRQPPELSVIALIRRLDQPMLWSDQQQVLGIR
jgi:site-specific DNA recombinase